MIQWHPSDPAEMIVGYLLLGVFAKCGYSCSPRQGDSCPPQPGAPAPNVTLVQGLDTAVLITGGFTDESPYRLTSVEVYPHTSCCSPPPLPDERVSHTTFLTSEPNPVIATCGGSWSYATEVCFVLDQSNQRWDESRMGDLTMPRMGAAVATLNYVGVFIIGSDVIGYGSNEERTSDFLAAGSMQWQEGPALPVDMHTACAVDITPTSFLAISDNHILEFDAALAGPTSSEGWRHAGRWPRLKTGRAYQPGCAKIGQKVIIAGGYSGGAFLRSTEVLHLGSRQISAGPEMTSPRYRFHLTTIRRRGVEKVFALGSRGVIALDSSEAPCLNTVEELVEVGGSTTWKRANSFLAQRRCHFGAVTVPQEFICPV